MLRIICTALLLLPLIAQAQVLSVLAIEYPPFTSAHVQRNGLAFSLLTDALSGSELEVDARFLPPARAHKAVQEGAWCVSFFPPQQLSEQFVFVVLDKEPVRLGLYRRREAGVFRWQQLSELKGKRVANFRALARDGIGLKMQAAGLEIVDVETFKQGLLLLERGRVDYAFGDPVSGRLLMSSLGIEAQDYQFSETLFGEVPIRVWLNLSCGPARTAFDYLNDHPSSWTSRPQPD